ncbi:hypothetical protein ABTF68_22805, partial [Acinetobacter baumannii]
DGRREGALRQSRCRSRGRIRKKIVRSGPIREALWLIFNGVSEDLAFGLDDATRSGWAIIMSEFHGSEFDTNTMTFKEK